MGRASNTFGGTGGHTVNMGGTIYRRGGANYEVRRHSLKRTIEIAPGKSKLIPLLLRTNDGSEPTSTNVTASSKITSSGSEVYHNISAQEGSYVKAVHLDMLITPKTLDNSSIIDFYVSSGAFSFHDLLSDQVYGLSMATPEAPIQYNNEASTPVKSNILVGDVPAAPPEMSLVKETYDLGDVIKHWWPRMTRNVLFAGQPVMFQGYRGVPRKCRRINPGTFWGLMILNDANSIASTETDTLLVEIKEQFIEIPLIQ